MRGFESHLPPHCFQPNSHIIGVSPSGKATDSDSVSRRFESCYPSQTNGARKFRASFNKSQSNTVIHKISKHMATWPSGKAKVCKTSIPQFESGCRLQKYRDCRSERQSFFGIYFFLYESCKYTAIITIPASTAAAARISWSFPT